MSQRVLFSSFVRQFIIRAETEAAKDRFFVSKALMCCIVAVSRHDAARVDPLY